MVAVLGGRGGAGATVLACGLAVTAVRTGRRALLVDGDPRRWARSRVRVGGVDGLRWPGLSHTAGLCGPRARRRAARRRRVRGPLRGSGRRPALPLDAMVAALDAGRRGWDLTVVDLPRRFDDATVAALSAVDHMLLVVPAEIRACAAARRVATEALRHTGSMSLVVRTPAPTRLSPREISRAMGLSLAGT